MVVMDATLATALRRRPVLTDALVAVLVALASAAGSLDKLVSWLPHLAMIPLALVQGTIVLTRRRAPFAVLAGTTAVAAFMITVGFPVGSAIAGVAAAAYAVALYQGGGVGGVGGVGGIALVQRDGAERPQTVQGALACVAAAAVVVVAMTTPASRHNSDSWDLTTVGVIVVAAWISGYAVRTRRAYIAELKERAARLEAEEGERAARAVADERLRIARELHDVIGHSISLITIQSEAAKRSARTNPDAVPGFLDTISAASREALTEMRYVLAVLRPDAQTELSPQPGLDALPELISRIESGGLKVHLDVEPLELPSGMGLAVYRIVQESLTNVLKHAGPGATAGVTIARGGDMLRVSVHDDGAGPSSPTSSTAHGIVGMRERVALYGGMLRTGVRPAGGFEVEAAIPWPEEYR
jgi:signal transduction histidine kinase